MNPIIDKIINADRDVFVIFFTYGCHYSEQALDLLRQSNVLYKGYDISDINGQMPKLLEILNENAKLIGFDSNHRTRPIIFLNGKFIGGYNELSKLISKN